MEVMDCSLDKFYRRVFAANETIPEDCLANISLSVSIRNNILDINLPHYHGSPRFRVV